MIVEEQTGDAAAVIGVTSREPVRAGTRRSGEGGLEPGAARRRDRHALEEPPSSAGACDEHVEAPRIDVDPKTTAFVGRRLRSRASRFAVNMFVVAPTFTRLPEARYPSRLVDTR